jgi:hypothetical protein
MAAGLRRACLLTSHHLTWGKRDFGHGDGIAPVSVLLAVAPISVLLAVFLTEVWRSMALLSEKLRDRIRDQGRKEGLSKGQALESSRWRDWFNRYEEARRKGEPFDEPPPDVR